MHSFLTNCKKYIPLFLTKYYLLAFTLLLLIVGSGKFGGFYGFYINGDGKGYYAYLPATFIYHDYNFSFINAMDEKYYPENARADFRKEINGKLTNKYFIGEAVLCVPFFLGAHLYSAIRGLPTDGYAPAYQYSILLAALFYLWVGLFFLRKLLRLYQFSERSTMLTLLLILFATPLVFYTCFNPDFSHVYSFAVIAAFAYQVKKWSMDWNGWRLLFSIVLLGGIVLIRPMNGIVVFSIPFLIGSGTLLQQAFVQALKQYGYVLLGGVLAALLISTQLTFYYLESGKWLIWSYTGEGFTFGSPHFIDVLFSYRRGLFVYTPLLFISLLGFYPLFRKNTFEGISLFIFLLAVIYAIASWHCWWYGMCFGLRPITEFLPFFAILLAALLESTYKRWIQVLGIIVLLFTLLYNGIQIYQYKFYILHWQDMDKARFWKIFMKPNSDYAGLFWATYQPLNEPAPAGKRQLLHFESFEQSTHLSNAHPAGFSGNHSILLNKQNQFYTCWAGNFTTFSDQALITIEASAFITLLDHVTGNTFNWVLTVENDKEVYVHQNFCPDLQLLHKNHWYYTNKVFTIRAPANKTDKLTIYIWQPGKQKILVDKISVCSISGL